MCSRLYLSLNLSLWLCSPDVQPMNCNVPSRTTLNYTNESILLNESLTNRSILIGLNNTVLKHNRTFITPSPSPRNTPGPSPRNAPSPSSKSIISPSPRNAPSPSSKSITSPSPSDEIYSVDNQADKTLLLSRHSKNNTNETAQDEIAAEVHENLSGLHALWGLLVVLIIFLFILRKKGVRVGFWKSKRPSRSKSWPAMDKRETVWGQRSRSSHGTKTEFDSINSIEL